MKKKKYLICGAVGLSILTLTGCNSNSYVSITKAMQNTKNIKTAKVESIVSVVVDDEKLSDYEVTGSIKNEVFKGQTMGTKFSGEIIRHISDKKMDISIPIMLDINAQNVQDTDIFITPSKHYFDMMGLEDKDTIYINPMLIQELFSGEIGEQYIVPINNKEKIITIFESVANENPEIVNFTKIKDKKITENGIYTINLNKDHIQSIFTSLIESDDPVILNGRTIDIDEKPIALYELGLLFENYKELSFKAEVVIENELVTQFKVTLVEEDNYIKEVTDVNIKYTDLGEEIQVDMPDKSAENVLDVVDMLSQ